LQISSPRFAMRRFIPSFASNWWAGNFRTTSSEWGSKTISSGLRVLYLSYRPKFHASSTVRHSTKVSPVSPISRWHVSALIISTGHRSSERGELFRGASRSQQEHKQVHHFIFILHAPDSCYIHKILWDSVQVYQQATERILKNPERTNKEQEEQGKCSEGAPFNLAKGRSILPNSFYR
jgi:hypothetical protein